MRMLLVAMVVVGACKGKESPPAPAPPPVTEQPPATKRGPKAPSGIDLPEVTTKGFVAADNLDGWISVVATPRALAVDGKEVMQIENGVIDPSEREGGALGLLIPRIQIYLQKLAAKSVLLLLDKQTPYTTLVSIMYSAKQAGVTKFLLAARVDDALVVAPIDIAESGPTTPLGLTITIERERITLWSKSGQEGTEDKPKLVITPISKYLDIVPALDDIAKRQSEHVIYLGADPKAPLQLVAGMIDAVRPSFPDVRVR